MSDRTIAWSSFCALRIQRIILLFAES